MARRAWASSLAFVLVFLLGWIPPAAALDPAKELSQYSHTLWRSGTGLPQDTVRSIAQTPDGYLWIGTRAGLARFDGLRMEVFDSRNTPELANHNIYALEVMPDGSLWIGTNGGGLVHRSADGSTWSRISEAQGLPSGRITALEPDGEGGLWIGTYGGGVARRHADGQIETFDPEQGIAGTVIFTLATDARGRLWVGTYGDGASIWEDGSFHVYQGPLPATGVWEVMAARDGSLWIGTNNGLVHVVDDRTRVFTEADGLTHPRVISLLEDRDGNIWIGTYGGGLHRYAGGRIVAFRPEHAEARDAVWDILEDREGGLWAGTLGRGLHLYRDGAITTYGQESGLESEMVISVHEGPDGEFYAGTRDRGLFRHDGERFVRVAGIDEQAAVWDITSSRDGSLWTATHRGLRRRAPPSSSHRDRWRSFTTAEGLAYDIVFALLEDREGTMWIGTNDGLDRYRDGDPTDGDPFEHFSVEDGLPSNQIRVLHQGRDGTLWVGTTGGLARFENGAFTRSLRTADSPAPAPGSGPERELPSGNIWALHEATDGSLWIATHGTGLLRLREGAISVIDHRHGLPDNDLEWVLEDDEGALWLGSSIGIIKLPRDNVEAVADGRSASLRYVAFGRRDGLRSGECYGGAPSAMRARDGRLWFGTREGLATLDPARVESPPAPPVQIEHLLVDGRKLRPAPGLRLPHSRSLTVRFAALTLNAPEKVQCQIRLRNWDDTWHLIGDRREMRYTNLDHGTYTFEVMASDRNGNWTQDAERLSFTIEPRFYETNLFFLLCGLGALALGFGLQQFRVLHLRERERELERRVDERTEAVHQANRELRAFTHTVSHDLRSPLVNLRGFSEELGMACTTVSESLRRVLPMLPQEEALQLREAVESDMPESLEFISSAINRMDRLIEKLLELSRAGARELTPEHVDVEALVREILKSQDFQLQQKDARAEVLSLPPITADRIALEQIFGNLLANAVNYLSPQRPGHLLISADSHADTVTYHVLDNGRGIRGDLLPHIFLPFRRGHGAEIAGEGMGLAFVQALVRRHGGEVSCESVEGEGTVFHVTLPKAVATS